MSALAQKRTFAVQNVISALPPKADIKMRAAGRMFCPGPRFRGGERIETT